MQTAIDRRQALRLIGGGVVVAAGAPGCAVFDPHPSNATAPWRTAGQGYADPRLRALSWAILAPNPHNRQPWRVRLDGDDAMTLYCDRSRLLPETDPHSRQIVIGLGCFAELARIASSADGLQLAIDPFPEGMPEARLDDRPIAQLRLTGNAATPDPLFAAAAARRSTKEPFDAARPVARATLAPLAQAAAFVDGVAFAGTTAAERVERLRSIAWRAHRIEVTTPRTNLESVELMRIGRAEIEADPDGIDLGGRSMEIMRLLGLIDREALADPASMAFSQGLAMYRELHRNTPAFVWLETPGNNRPAQFAAGRAWLRVNLAATAAGLALHPVSQALQEYREMSAPYTELHALLARNGATVQMLGRLGYSAPTPPSPRWPLARAIMT